MTAAGTRVPSLTVFFPAYNEEDIIEKTVSGALAACSPVADDLEVIVVDDGSADRTAAIVEKLSAADPRVRLVRHERNRGYGAALRTGFASARKELVFFSDADGQFDLRELPGSLAMLAQAPVVAGYRIKRNDPPHRLFIARTYKLIIRLVFGLRIRDIDCAFKLFRRDVFDGLTLESNGAFISSELLIKLSRRGVPIAERGVNHYPRTTGYSKGAGVGVILKTIKDILRLRFGLSLASSR
ncbi:MAG TPA: glycosyltransferase family 2 protein [Candidatus Eremiobacteraceae bacterium]|nr:glycosyltransferase family 2 protein [Candidatus Eremiobacteraceae bacterium]